MCVSRFHLVLAVPRPGSAEVRDSNGVVRTVSLLALDGPAPQPGEWLVVHSGYAFDRVARPAGPAEARAAGSAPAAPFVCDTYRIPVESAHYSAAAASDRVPDGRSADHEEGRP